MLNPIGECLRKMLGNGLMGDEFSSLQNCFYICRNKIETNLVSVSPYLEISNQQKAFAKHLSSSTKAMGV